jgi:hypothetical protein
VCVRAPLHRERRHSQSHDPAFRARFERSSILGREIQAHHLAEEGSRLVAGEAEVGNARKNKDLSGLGDLSGLNAPSPGAHLRTPSSS